MSTGIDFSFSRVPPSIAKAAGHSFAISYLTDLDTAHRAKAWTASEVQAYRAAGLGVVAVWQGGGSDRTTAWRGGYDRGRRDARLAAQQASALGRPDGAAGRPVYFAVDYDVQPGDLPAVAEYFRGVASVFDRQNIGIYGGRRAVEWAMASGAAAWWWQTGAWSGSYRAPGIHLYQRVPSTSLGGYAIDIDDAMRPDYGQWFDPPGGGTPVAWCPFAQRMELQPESNSQVAIRPTQFILHSIAAPWTVQRIYEYWRDSTNLESHFGLGFDGSLGQFIGTQTRADASAQANSRAISLESASNLQHTDPWTDAQVAMIIRLGVWLCQTHGIPARKPTAWDAPGIGYHRMFRQWSTDGTACPGDARVRQFDQLILPGIQRGVAGGPIPQIPQEDEMTPAEMTQLADLVTERLLTYRNPDDDRAAQAAGGRSPQVYDILGRIDANARAAAERAEAPAPTPVTVDAAAVAAALAADPTLLAAIARAVADEDHKRTES